MFRLLTHCENLRPYRAIGTVRLLPARQSAFSCNLFSSQLTRDIAQHLSREQGYESSPAAPRRCKLLPWSPHGWPAPRRGLMRDHSGWRARIGLIYMASSTVMEPEFYEMSPEGVATCTIRTHLPKMDVAGLEQMTGSDDLERCTAYLARADLGVIAYGGTSATFLHGLAWDQKMQARMSANSNRIPVTTTSSASIAALRAVGARRISFV